MMGPDDKNTVSFPFFVFENTKQKLESLVDTKAHISVERRGVGVASDKSLIENKLLFEGAENPMIYDRVYSEQFDCDYQLSWYPFDRQHCTIVIRPTDDLMDYVDIAPAVLRYAGPSDLREFLVTGIKITKTGKNVVVTVSIARMLMSIILTTFLPTIILNLIGHTANYFKPFFFEAVIALNASVMLVLTTMFINVSNNLPKTAYIKMIDIWLLFNLFKPFVDIIMQTFIESLKTDEEEGREVNHHGKTIKVGQVGQEEQLRYEEDKTNKVTPDILRSRDEKKQKDALVRYYKHMDRKKKSRVMIAFCKKFSRVYYPIACVVFIVIFWIVGFAKYNQ